MRMRAILLGALAALAGAAMAMLPGLAVAASEAKLEVNGNCVENGWPCWAASGSGPKPAPASDVAIAAGGEVVFTDNTTTKTNIAWLGTAPVCSPGVPVSPTPPQTNWEGRCKFEQSGTYRFESSTLFKGAGRDFTKYEILVEGGTTLSTKEATDVTEISATLQASVNPNGEEVTECRFEYGTTASYGSSAPCSPSPGSGTSPVEVSAALQGLVPNTTYHFRISATNEGGTSNGADETFTTSAAIRNPPEFGRCKAVTGEMIGSRTVFHGSFKNKSCTMASSEHSGRYEWLPGVERTHFTDASAPGKTILFETVSGRKVMCTAEMATGEYTSPKLEENVVFRFTGCDFQGQRGSGQPVYPVFSEGAPEGEIFTEPTECELGVVKKGGTAMKDTLAETCAEEEEFMWFKWKMPGYLGSAFEPELCIRGWWFFTLKSNSMSSRTVNLLSQQSKGVQKYEKFVEGPPEPLEGTLSRGESFELMGLQLTSTQTNEEPVEANSVV